MDNPKSGHGNNAESHDSVSWSIAEDRSWPGRVSPNISCGIHLRSARLGPVKAYELTHEGIAQGTKTKP